MVVRGDVGGEVSSHEGVYKALRGVHNDLHGLIGFFNVAIFYGYLRHRSMFLRVVPREASFFLTFFRLLMMFRLGVMLLFIRLGFRFFRFVFPRDFRVRRSRSICGRGRHRGASRVVQRVLVHDVVLYRVASDGAYSLGHGSQRRP